MSTISWTTYHSPLGRLTLTADAAGALTGLPFPGHAPAPAARDRRGAPFAAAIEQLDEYFAGTRRDFDLPLDLTGTAFQQAVWRELQRIPHGTTVSYGEVARRIGRPDRVRAVGAAIGRNPISIVVACHRVIGADGGLTGYGGGLDRKRALLETEAAVAAGDGAPTAFGPRQLALL